MNGGKLVIGTELNTKQFDAQIVKLERRLNDVEASLKMAEEDKTLFSTSEIEDMEAEVEVLRNRIGTLRGDFKKTGDSGKNIGDETSKGIEKGVKSLKRFGLSLFGIQSMYRLVSRASSAYLSQDIELAEKLQNVWVGLGSFLAPVIEYISNALLKLLGYFNEFIKALTGVDFIARANAKALEKQAQAQDKLNKATQQYDFDVIRKQQAPTESSTGSGNGLIEIPELNQGVVEKLRKFAEILRENWDLIKDVGIALGVTFGAVKIAGLLKNIGLLIGSASAGTGLAFLNFLLGSLVAVASIEIIFNSYQKIKDQLQELNDMKDQLTGITGSLPKEQEEVKKGILERYEELTPDEQGRLYTTTSVREQTKNLDDNDTKILKNYLKTLQVGISTYKELYKQGRLTDQGKKDYEKLLLEEIDLMNRLEINTSAVKQEYYELTGQQYSLKIRSAELAEEIFGLNEVFKETGKVNERTKTQIDNFSKSLDGVTTASDTLQEQYTSNLNYIMESTTDWNETIKQEFANQIQKMKDLGFNVDDVAQKYKDLVGEDYTIKVTGTFEDKSGTKITTFADKVKQLLNMSEVSNFTKTILSSSAKMFGLKGFAQGGIVTQPTRALIGEAGYPEAVVPMTQDYLSTLASEIAKYGGGGGNINVYLDGKLIQRTTAKASQKNDFVRNR